MKNRLNQIFSSGLRGATLLSRFLLTIFLAKYVSPEEVGLFALYWAGITLASSIMGLDVYSFTTRSLLKPDMDKARILSLHTGFLIVSGGIFIPLSAFLFYSGGQQISSFLIILYFFHLPFEYFSHEISRLLIPLGRPLVSTVILFIRSAIWIPIVIAGLIFNWDVDPIEMTVILWLIGSLVSSLISFSYIKIATKVIITPSIDFTWIKVAIASSGIFLAGTIIFRVIIGGDKFIISNLLSIDILGIYTVYASTCLGVLGLLESGISAWRYPKLVSAIQSDNLIESKIRLWSFWKENFISSLVLMSIVVFLFRYLSKSYLDDIYTDNILGFYIIAFGVFLYSISMPFHYFIFGHRRDISFVFIYTMALIMMLIWGWGFMEPYGVVGASIMLSLALSVIALMRWAFMISFLYRQKKNTLRY